jgi:4-amino-4-deoxy-L-arabinose transferase-like glycosyltransferase
MRPHPPGYVFYVGAAAALRWLTGDSNGALVIVSVLASALTAAAVYLAARRYADRTLAVLVALGAALAPLPWTYGEIAMPYALLGLLSVVLAISLLDARTRRWPAALIVSAGLGLAAGFRQDVLLLLGPLWLWMLASRSWRERALCVVAVGLASLAWLVPSALLSGGLAAYIASLSGQITRVSELSPAAGGNALLGNTLLTIYGLWWGLLGFALVLAAAAVTRLIGRRLLPTEDAVFFALWLIPAAIGYVTIHIGDPGYLMSVLPGCYVACAALLATLTAATTTRVVLIFTAVLVSLNAVASALTDAPMSARALERHDRSLVSRVTFVRGHYAPDSVVILAQSEYLTARYYLPEYRVLFYGVEPEALSRAVREVRLGASTEVVVFGELALALPATLRLTRDGGVASGRVDPATSLVAYDLEPR